MTPGNLSWRRSWFIRTRTAILLLHRSDVKEKSFHNFSRPITNIKQTNNVQNIMAPLHPYNQSNKNYMEQASRIPGRSEWISSEMSPFSKHNLTLQTLDLVSNAPRRSVECIILDALMVCEGGTDSSVTDQ